MTVSVDDLFILGAGTSAHSGAPLGKQFLGFVERGCDSDPRFRNLREFLHRFFPPVRGKCLYPKFEELISLIDIAIARGESLDSFYQEREIIQLRNDMNYLIWKTLEFVKNLRSEDLHTLFIEKCLKRGNAAVISLNYDTLIDYSLEEMGLRVDYGFKFSNSVVASPSTTTSVTLIKIHGSLNWLYCPTCLRIYRYRAGELSRVFSPDPELCPDDGTYLKGIIVPPTYLKNYMNPYLALSWKAAGTLLKRARRIHFLGSSFSEADMWFKFLVKKFIFLNSCSPEINVVNPEKRSEIRERYERLLGPVTYIQKSFGEWLHEMSD
ncbi:MAG: hypothetical protein CVV64_09855 [Candidatus Wallbacteria bacterium HGW-Wallbacteria-1]|jgi:NAD-dependent SIR2 family protein deacetylase|uniref:Uncharacterized protein n=1 Tax=Candidatus Wallbacteria bacterium HGW-Wallbacteria-1 TaxID=2013854 RepID=A0A2N1PPK0_9BACT|nr:MAG: hypothetical protein CVV64_09855 [Candidatus Wallbacteria bacterium HGW-Wallbacteria-1]